MFGKFLKLAGILLVASILLSQTGVALADEAPGTGPETAFSVPDSQVTIPAGGELWFAFNYLGDGSKITVDMSGDFQSPTHQTPLTQFTIWTPAEVQKRALHETVTPVGAGAANTYGYNPDMIWTSNFNARGTYYIVVDQSSQRSGSFHLTLTGSSVTPAGQPMASSGTAPSPAPTAVLAATAPSASAPVTPTVAPAASVPVTPTAAPAVSAPVSSTVAVTATTPVSTTAAVAVSAPVTPTVAPAPTAPATAVVAPAASPSISGTGPGSAFGSSRGWVQTAQGAATWYAFQYRGDGSPITVDMQVNPAAAAGFAVWTPQSVQTMQGGQLVIPIGLGAINPNEADDLIWTGSLHQPGTYYVLVAQSGPPGSYNLTITGSGVTFGQ